MGMKVEIVSRETVKPSSPTPQGLRTFNLSILDQTASRIYVPIVLFYSNNNSNNEYNWCHKRFTSLKKSLSETLTHMYPLAGRLKDQYSIDCNDQGADYIRACINGGDMSTLVLKHPQMDVLRQLLPCVPHPLSTDPNTEAEEVLLSVQVNEFDCGGMAIGVCVHHAIADASSAATFIKNWASVARRGNSSFLVDEDTTFVRDCTGLFPPEDVRSFLTDVWKNQEITREPMTKRYVFDGCKIAALREKANEIRPTRIEALVAFIWGALIAAARERNKSLKIHSANCAVDLRKRIDPPLPPQTIGNIFQFAAAMWEAREESVDYEVLVKRVRESMLKVNNESVRKLHADGGLLKAMKQGESATAKSGEVGWVLNSSWCRFPFYEADFGWGKPIWVANCLKLNNTIIFMDSSDGEGIEAWVSMPEEDIHKLDHNPDFLAYVSSTQVA